MNLKLEKDLKVAVEMNGEIVVTSMEGMLYQQMDDKDIHLLIKGGNGQEIKIKISK